MRKADYINSASVKDFIKWIEPRLGSPNGFCHSYLMKKPAKHWACDSIYSAYETYHWPFRSLDPYTGHELRGSSLEDSARYLGALSLRLRNSIENMDHAACSKYCLLILQWGGVRNKNDKRIQQLGSQICNYFREVEQIFSSDLLLSDYYRDGIIMNSGFTKIYALYLEDFIIYDGRVGAALGFLVRKFCEDMELNQVPPELLFAWGRGKEQTYKPGSINRRNPSKGHYIFPELLNNPKRHTESNIKANWLLKAILDNTQSKFNKLDQKMQLIALQSALFMIGYCVVDIN